VGKSYCQKVGHSHLTHKDAGIFEKKIGDKTEETFWYSSGSLDSTNSAEGFDIPLV